MASSSADRTTENVNYETLMILFASSFMQLFLWKLQQNRELVKMDDTPDLFMQFVFDKWDKEKRDNKLDKG